MESKDGAEDYWAKSRFQLEGEAKHRRFEQGKSGQRLTGWAIAEVEALLAGGPVLDLACGNGRHLPGLLELDVPVFAADISLPMLTEARRLVAERSAGYSVAGRLVRLDAEHLPFPESTFDVVFCARFFHHLPTRAIRENILKEMFRISRRGVVLTAKTHMSFEHIREKWQALLRGEALKRYYIRLGEITEIAEAHGWRLKAQRTSGPFMSSNRAMVLVPGSRSKL
jgi:ubiquinone/menaquinone biosynthesis C-methylase UbiE